MHPLFLRFFIVLLPLLALPILGAWLLKTGIWSRRRGQTPHCAGCGYNLTGLTTERCPECGRALAPDGVAYGERRRSPGRIVGGTVCLLPLGLVATLIVGNVDWYRLAPTFLLISDLQSKNPNRSWNELDRRIKAGALSSSSRSKIIDIALKEQASPPSSSIGDELLSHLGTWAAAGLLSDAQARTFYDQLVTLTIRARARVVQGDYVPVEVARKGSGPSNITISLNDGGVFVDGEELRVGSGSSSFSGRGAGGSSVRYCRYNKIGRHGIEARSKMSVFLGPTTGVPIHQCIVSLKTSFEIVPPSPQDAIRLKPDPALKDAIHQAISPEEFEFGRHRKDQLSWTYQVDKVPANVAFEVFARIKGTEHRLGTLHINAGGSSQWGTSVSLKMPPFTRLDLILRSSEKVARETVDMYEIWQGELIYEGLPVKLGPYAATQAVTSPASAQDPQAGASGR